MEVIRSGFFQQSSSKLSEQLRDDNGIGFALAETLKIDYQGEGIVNFMNSMRNSKKESEQDAKKDEDK